MADDAPGYITAAIDTTDDRRARCVNGGILVGPQPHESVIRIRRSRAIGASTG
jgi:hypothetical protein